jgi:hypothetical protein
MDRSAAYPFAFAALLAGAAPASAQEFDIGQAVVSRARPSVRGVVVKRHELAGRWYYTVQWARDPTTWTKHHIIEIRRRGRVHRE